MSLEQQLVSVVVQALPYALGAGFSLLTTTWRVYRQNRYLRELLRREQALNISRQNALVRILVEAFSKGPNPTLEQLLQDTEAEFELLRSRR